MEQITKKESIKRPIPFLGLIARFELAQSILLTQYTL